MPTPNEIAKFWAHVVINANGCWLFVGTSGNYGICTNDGKIIGANRFSWLIHYGQIPHKLCVLHKCDVPRCINPSHLFLGNHKANTADMIAKKRNNAITQPACFAKCEKNGRAKLTITDVYDIRLAYDNGTKRREIMAIFCITGRMVWLIGTRKNWKTLAEKKVA